MWLHPTTQNNLKRLASFGNTVIPVQHGELASGLIGPGRMAEPEELVEYLATSFNPSQPLKGLNALVTAGPTYERLDPVRYIGNFSTGKMGIAIADALATQGANVTLVCGPTQHKSTHAAVHTIAVESASAMHQACMGIFPTANISVMAAAVADYRPETIADEKIKKVGTALELKLVKTTDILLSLGEIKQPWQTLIGFALETENEENNAKEKLLRKNTDAIILNSLKDEGAGFGHDTNKITIITATAAPLALPLQSKKEAAEAIVKFIINNVHAEQTA
jgi:phosphopantothenoylcysteine decarboxylase/phosphopantothenate--cysteine ligase